MTAGSSSKLLTRPYLTIYVAWHPKFAEGKSLAKAIYDHYRRNLYENVAGGTGIPVIYRYEPPTGQIVPIDIDLSGSETCAVVLLVDDNWANDPDWTAWAKQLADQIDQEGFGAMLFPVAIHKSALNMRLSEQAVRWDKWDGEPIDVKCLRLFTSLSYQFCRMLRFYLEHLENPNASETDLTSYLQKVKIFVSHSKHDDNGVEIALLIRQFLQNGSFGSFFDVYDIPIGVRFNEVLLEEVRTSAVVAIHTDSYSSREWCRREMIEAKRYNVPLVIANCIENIDERGFPYMANVPIVRMDPIARDRVDVIVSRLIDEILKDFLWRSWVKITKRGTNVAFIPRPPELISLASLLENPGVDYLVYPDPPIGAEEKSLFEVTAPAIELASATEWLAGDR